MTTGRRIQIVIGLILALGLPFAHLGNLGKRYSGLGPLWGGEVLWWVLFVVILLYVLLVEQKPLASLRFVRPRAMDLVWGVVAAIVAVIGIGVIFSVVLPALHLSFAQKFNAMMAAPFLFRVLLVTRAAVIEETLFRGYGFERIAELTGSTSLAAVLTFALFTLAHYSGGGLAQVLIAAWGGIVLTALYVWRRNLWASILCHWLTDGAGFLLMPAMGAHH